METLVKGIVIVLLANLFFICQSNPNLTPTLSFYTDESKPKVNNDILNAINPSKNTTVNNSTTHSSFIGFAQITNGSQWSKAGERSLGVFLPLLSMPSDIKIGLSGYIIKIVGGAVVFGLIAIDLRRRFERKYTH
jgi:hypothetical protein